MINNYEFFCQTIGLLLLIDFIAYLPWYKVWLGPGYWPGRRFHRPPYLYLLLAVWAFSILSVMTGFYRLAGAVTLWVLFRHFYIKNRWSSLLRGGGAPGFISHYLVMFIALFEGAAFLDRSGSLTAHTMTLFRVDLGVILLCSGTYKCLAGYLKDEGMEYGLANPFWSYFFGSFRKVSPSHPFFRIQDRFAALGQVLTGILMVLSVYSPALGYLGALGCIGAFLYLACLIRLGRLAFMMMAAPLLFLPQLSVPHVPFGIAAGFPPLSSSPTFLISLFHGAIVLYLILLPLVKIMQYLNLFANRSLPEPLQSFLTRFANFVPIIVWRVFTADVTNFFIRISSVDQTTGQETVISDENTVYSYRNTAQLRSSLRFLHVVESISLTTVFTTLKYFPSKREMFNERLLNYARTIPHVSGDLIRFTYVSIQKAATEFLFGPVMLFTVNTQSGDVLEEHLSESFQPERKATFSPIRESVDFGNYVKAR